MMALPELEQTIRKLPPAARKELIYFVDYLQYKYQPAPADEVVKLGGLWADINLDVSDDDVRALRQQVTLQLMNKV
jgi:hypothetical protein